MASRVRTYPRNLMLAWLWLGAIYVAFASEYDPHIPSQSATTWFEGWYTRVVASDTSFGMVVGHMVGVKEKAALAAILSHNASSNQLVVSEVYPSSVLVRQNGAPVRKDPEISGPPDFYFSCEDGSCELAVDEKSFVFTVSVGKTEFYVKSVGSNTFWGPGGASPEGLGVYLPVSLHWFVYSLSTPVEWMYSTKYEDGTQQQHSGVGYAHMEKNWGVAFPDSWVWAQGMAVEKDNNTLQAGFALAGGKLPSSYPLLSSWLPRMWLLGFRSPSLSLDFQPYNALFHTATYPCSGTFHLTAYGLFTTLELSVRADPGTFSSLSCPTLAGFRKESVESYAAEAAVKVYQRSLFGGRKLLEEHVLRDVAIEFGGTARCPDDGAVEVDK